MKNILLLVLVLSIASALKLQIGQRLTLQQAYEIACLEAQGKTQFQAFGLPSGVQLRGNTLQIHDYNQVKDGSYPITIRVRDSAGHIDQQNVVISVQVSTSGVQANAGNSGSISLPSPPAPSTSNNGQNNGVNLSVQDNARVDAILNSLPLNLNSPSNSNSSAPIIPQTNSSSSNIFIGYNPNQPNTNDNQLPNFPTGSSSIVPNPTTLLISDAQATRTDTSRNRITADDVATKAAFQRQSNAGFALANLLAIVKQTTANRNAANQQVVKRQNLYDTVVKRQREAQAGYDAASNNLNKLIQGIAYIGQNIDQLKSQLNDFSNQFSNEQNTLVTLKQEVQTTQNRLNNVDQQQNGIENNKRNVLNQKGNRQLQCNNFGTQISNLNIEKDHLIQDLKNIAPLVDNAQDKVNANTNRVNDLQAQLRAAQSALANSQNELNGLQNQQNNLQGKINDKNNHIQLLKASQNQCQPDLERFDNLIKQLNDQLAAVNQKKAEIADQITKLTTQITSIDEFIKNGPTQVSDINKKIAELQKNLGYLQSQKPAYEVELNNSKGVNDAAANEVRAAKQNLEAATKRYSDETNNLNNANRNIELARTQKQQADEAVNQLLQQNAQILPFPAAPDATTFGNPLRDGAYPIGNWPNFVRSVYGAGVKPLFSGDLNSLYSFMLPGQSNGNGATGNEDKGAGNIRVNEENTQNSSNNGSEANSDKLPGRQCEKSNQSAVAGYLVGVIPGSFLVSTDGGTQFRITYADCTVALASKQNYVPKSGDIVMVKGVAEGTNGIKATQCAFVEH